MSRFRKRLDSGLISEIAPWLDHVEKGSPPLHEALALVNKNHLYASASLVNGMNPPARMDEYDRRALHIAAGCGNLLKLCQWMARDLGREQPADDLHGDASAGRWLTREPRKPKSPA